MVLLLLAIDAESAPRGFLKDALVSGQLERASSFAPIQGPGRRDALEDCRPADALRDGNWVYYSLAPQNDASCKSLLRVLVGAFAKHETLRADVARLLKAKGPRACVKDNARFA